MPKVSLTNLLHILFPAKSHEILLFIDTLILLKDTQSCELSLKLKSVLKHFL